MDLIERRIACRNRQRCQRPGPSPASAPAANSPKQQQTENKILREVRRLANEVMDHIELLKRERWPHPMQYRIKDRSCVVGRKRIRGHRKNHASPQQRRPPRTQKLRHEIFRRHALPDFLQRRRRPRIAPRLFSQFLRLPKLVARLQPTSTVCSLSSAVGRLQSPVAIQEAQNFSLDSKSPTANSKRQTPKRALQTLYSSR